MAQKDQQDWGRVNQFTEGSSSLRPVRLQNGRHICICRRDIHSRHTNTTGDWLNQEVTL